MERRVVLLSRDPGLAAIAHRLLINGDQLAHFRSATELSDWERPAVAAVILDSQPQARRLSYKQVRDRYHGPLVMLLDKGERRPDLPPDAARQFLHRPFQAAELSKLLAVASAGLQPLEAAIIGAWSRHATAETAAPATPRRGPSYRVNWRPSLRRRVRAWAATIVALIGLLLVFSLSDQGPCAPGCTSFGGAVAGATESQTPFTAPPPASGGGAGRSGRPPGSSAASSQPPTPTGGLPLVSGIGGLIQDISPITSDDPTPPSGPRAVPGVPAPPGVDPPPTTSPPPGTTPPPPTTTPPPTVPPSTAPPPTDPPTTAPPPTDPPTTAPPPTNPPTTAPPPTEPPTTAPPPTEPPTTAPPPTEPPTTAPAPTEPPTTAASPTAPSPTT